MPKRISMQDLRPADIILSTTSAYISGFIRTVSWSDVSHAALYTGDGHVIEAIGSGVQKVSFTEALEDDYLAIAYRREGLTEMQAKMIVLFANMQIGKPYDLAGAARFTGNGNEKLFCSELVCEAYRQARVPVVERDPSLSTPKQIITDGKVMYVGHLKNVTPPPVYAPPPQYLGDRRFN